MADDNHTLSHSTPNKEVTRLALVEIRKVAADSTDGSPALQKILQITDAALSTPPRVCDRFNASELKDFFRKEFEKRVAMGCLCIRDTETAQLIFIIAESLIDSLMQPYKDKMEFDNDEPEK